MIVVFPWKSSFLLILGGLLMLLYTVYKASIDCRCLQIPVDGYAASYKVPLLYDRDDEM